MNAAKGEINTTELARRLMSHVRGAHAQLRPDLCPSICLEVLHMPNAIRQIGDGIVISSTIFEARVRGVPIAFENQIGFKATVVLQQG